ncbi:hypothetical protein JR316_0009309 [Psilocybe cubensis]|uniref:Uncharacterized protein n=1 Tax=Psilocybe cubensis TaxID=181762 RepID=A0ACB8GTT9_PSICU|nr:hypothetical protein JR316_0009309 [Psilocybe cubensis]KAH9478847.1 hypothetical protein JR316_0009309 [Psilocybe cubensis]
MEHTTHTFVAPQHLSPEDDMSCQSKLHMGQQAYQHGTHITYTARRTSKYQVGLREQPTSEEKRTGWHTASIKAYSAGKSHHSH